MNSYTPAFTQFIQLLARDSGNRNTLWSRACDGISGTSRIADCIAGINQILGSRYFTYYDNLDFSGFNWGDYIRSPEYFCAMATREREEAIRWERDWNNRLAALGIAALATWKAPFLSGALGGLTVGLSYINPSSDRRADAEAQFVRQCG